MAELSDLTRTAQQFLKLIAQDHLYGKMRHDLRELAVKHNCAFQDIHADIKELTDAHAIRMERLGCSNGSASVQFHIFADTMSVSGDLNEAQFDGA